MDKRMFVRSMTEKVQKSIQEELEGIGVSEEDVERGLDSRLCDLEDTIDTTKYME